MRHLTGDLLEPVLSVVANFYQAEIEWINDESNYNDEHMTFSSFEANEAVDIINHSSYWHYGWVSEEDIPTFTDTTPIKSQHSEYLLMQEKGDHPRRVNTLLKIIAALLDYSAIKLEDSNTVHHLEDLTTEIDLRVGEDTVKDVLLEVKKILEKPTKSTKKS
jgi:hypothetical protein